MGVGVSQTLLPVLGTLSSYWAAPSSLDVRVYAHLVLLHFIKPYRLISLGSLIFSEAKLRNSGSRREGKWEGGL